MTFGNPARTAIVVGLFAAMLTSGCGNVLDEPGAVARPVAPNAAASAPPYDRDAQSARVKKALIETGAMASVGVGGEREDKLDVSETTSQYCNLRVLGEGTYSHVAHSRSWRSWSVAVYQTAHGYNTLTGKEAVDATRRNAHNCTTYEIRYSDGSRVRFDLLDEIDLGTIAGVDASYARCFKQTSDTDPPSIACEAYLGHDTLLTDILVYSGDTVASASATLRQIVPIAAAALAAS
jgi:hypothetical protein